MIFYFSATGNTRWAALRLATALREQLFYVPDVMAQDTVYTLAPGERLGFVFPVHGWRVPAFIREFFAHVRVSAAERPYVYTVCTAGDSIGDTMHYLRRSIARNEWLRAMGIQDVDSAWSLIMPESYVGLPGMDVDTPEKEKRKKAEAAEALTDITQRIYDRERGVRRLTRGWFPWLLSHVVGGFFERVLVTDKHFHVVKARCVKCGICANVCPTQDIEGGHGKMPRWKHNGQCLTCFNCYHHCPHHAIEFGNQTRKKGQYFFK